MRHVVRDVVVLGEHVGAEVPHTEGRGEVEALHLRLDDFERVLDCVVLERLGDSLVVSNRGGDGARAGERPTEVCAEVHRFGYTRCDRCALRNGFTDTTRHGFAE